MPDIRFDLTVNREDILDIWKAQLQFKLFSKPNYARLAYATLFFVGAVTNLFNFWNLENHRWWFVLSLIGCIWQCFDIYKDYAASVKSQKQIHDWIDTFSRFKEHWLIVGENDFTYHRDHETHLYDLAQVKEKFSNGQFFQLRMNDGGSLIIPSKAFAAGKYDEFVGRIEAVIANVNQTTGM